MTRYVVASVALAVAVAVVAVGCVPDEPVIDSSVDSRLVAIDGPSRSIPEAINNEHIAAGNIDLATVALFERHARGKVGCTFGVDEGKVLCATDELNDDWSIVGTRVLRVDPATFEIEQHIVAPKLHSSYLWGDFNSDGAPDFFGFSDQEEPGEEGFAFLYTATDDPWVFTQSEPVHAPNPSKGGGVIDIDGDGCEDVLVLGTAREDWNNNVFTYFPDELWRGDCTGGFTVDVDDTGLRGVSGFDGAPSGSFSYGRTTTFTDLDSDGCVDVVVGNYRAQADVYLLGDCRGHLTRWSLDPDIDTSRYYFGHTVGLFPIIGGLDGSLDLMVFNLDHPDDRGDVTDPSFLLHRSNDELTKTELPYFIEAPFAAFAADLDDDGKEEVMVATGSRWGDYLGKAGLLIHDQLAWTDATEFFRMKETPVIVDANLDGLPDVIGDGRALASSGTRAGSFLGLIFETGQTSGTLIHVTDADGGVTTHVLAQDGRGQPGNMLLIPLGARVPVSISLRLPATAEDLVLGVEGIELDRYYRVNL